MKSEQTETSKCDMRSLIAWVPAYVYKVTDNLTKWLNVKKASEGVKFCLNYLLNERNMT